MIIKAARSQDPRTSGGKTLPQLLIERAQAYPDRACMREKKHGVWVGYTWREVLERVQQTACGLAALGLQRGDVLAVLSENIVESFWAEYAALALGARVVFAYPDLTAQELLYILDHSEAKMLLAEDQEQVDKFLAIQNELPRVVSVIYVDPRGLWNYREPLLRSYADVQGANALSSADFIQAAIEAGRQDDVAAICYTSGTTGRPKGAMLSHRFLLENAYRIMAAHRVRPHAEYLSYISPAWATEQFMGFALGLLAPLVINFSEKPDTVKRDLREVGPEYLLFTPRQWEMLASDVQAHMLDAGPIRRALYGWAVKAGAAAREPDASFLQRRLALPIAERLVLRPIRDVLGLSKTSAVLSGGSGLSPELFRLFHALGVSLRNLYGSTELGVLSSHSGSGFDPATMGELLPSDPTIAQPIEAWVDAGGQLRVRCCAFSGYLKNEAATAELGRAEEGFCTGDAVRVDARKQLIFLDRLKDLRRLRTGQRFPPQFIENSLRASPFIRDVMVLGDEDCDFVAALINVNPEICGRFAERHGLAFGTFSELSQLPEIRAEIAAAIREVNGRLETGARVASFVTLPKELDADEAELTRSRKLRREQIAEHYRDIIGAIYAGVEHVIATIEARYQDGRKAKMTARVAVNRIAEANSC
ncbi:MAG: AMP-dependent synthetase/ligase [Xanthobacteraceae bacterium]